MNIENLLVEKKGTVLDVRSYEEYVAAHAPGSINIPLGEIPHELEKIKSLKRPLILCCASGNRSGMAERLLSAQGIDCCNGGSWMDINYLLSQLQTS